MDKKTGFVVYRSWRPIIETLNAEQAKDLLQAIFAYQDGESVKLDGVLGGIFEMIRTVFDEDRRRYEDRCEKNRQAINKRYERIQTNTNEYKCIPIDMSRDDLKRVDMGRKKQAYKNFEQRKYSAEQDSELISALYKKG